MSEGTAFISERLLLLNLLSTSNVTVNFVKITLCLNELVSAYI